MRALLDMDTIQVEITNACQNRCANCTRFVGLVKPFFMSFETFKKCIDSMVGFPNMTGIMGGEPLLHPEFEKFCEYALSQIPREQLGLWTCLPAGYEKYREIICKTFGNIFINDHTRDDIYHHPFLVAAKDVLNDINAVYYAANKCYFQDAWSASINPHGAYFCEIAASLSVLYRNSLKGWEIESGWWKRTPKDYTEQIEFFCKHCGGCLFLKRRKSTDNGVYDVSPYHKKLSGNFVDHDLVQIKPEDQEQLANYKDPGYRSLIAGRYGIFLTVNEKCFNEPHLLKDFSAKDTIFDRLKRKYT